jgi:hypothetical protein
MSNGLFWLSFCDQGRPDGGQFLGVCIVEAASMASSPFEAHLQGINPGGEVQIIDITASADGIASPWRGRLLSREEAERFRFDGCGVLAPIPRWLIADDTGRVESWDHPDNPISGDDGAALLALIEDLGTDDWCHPAHTRREAVEALVEELWALQHQPFEED